jgi:hypothetical protein
LTTSSSEEELTIDGSKRRTGDVDIGGSWEGVADAEEDGEHADEQRMHGDHSAEHERA